MKPQPALKPPQTTLTRMGDGYFPSAGGYVWMNVKPIMARYQVGDHLWVRETFGYCLECGGINWKATVNQDRFCQSCDNEIGKWRPSIHMPRLVSRLTLDVTGVRVERVQDMEKRDAIAEGVYWSEAFPEGYTVTGNGRGFGSAEDCFVDLWDSINAKRGHSWQDNPWVWVVEFQRADDTNRDK